MGEAQTRRLWVFEMSPTAIAVSASAVSAVAILWTCCEFLFVNARDADLDGDVGLRVEVCDKVCDLGLDLGLGVVERVGGGLRVARADQIVAAPKGLCRAAECGHGLGQFDSLGGTGRSQR